MSRALVVTGGELRGRRLKPPSNRAVRPTAARVREALFSILGQQLDEQRVLDLFAGTGTLGIEAASRGATDIVFVEKDRGHIRLIESNAKLVEGIASVSVLCRDACSAVVGLAEGPPFHLAFLDPPYGSGLAASCLESIAPLADQLFDASAVLVVESDGRETLPECVGLWARSDTRKYGQTSLDFYRHGEARK